MSNAQSPNLQELLCSLSNGTLSEGEGEQLDALLGSDAAARQKYLEHMAVEAELFASHAQAECPAVNADCDMVELASVGQSAQGTLAATSSDSTSPADRRQIRWRSVLAVAASLIGVAVASSWLTLVVNNGASSVEIFVKKSYPADSKAVETSAESPLTPPPIVAKISATRNCRWVTPVEGVGFGAKLAAGQRLELAAGLAEITFDCGATIILEGPASLDINDATNAYLLDGRLAAVVPSEAPTFSLRTRTLGVCDSVEPGQRVEFGMLADKRGGEVHVFNGPMRAHLLDGSGAQVRSVLLKPKEAASVRHASTTVAKFQANGDTFVRSLFSGGGPHSGLYAYEGFDYPSGPLSWQNGGFGWAGPWADIEASGGQHGEATNLVAEQSLRFADLTSNGNRAIQTAQRNRIRRALSTSIGGVFDTAGLVENHDGHRLLGRDGRRLYFSFLQQVDKTDDIFYGFELHRGDGNANRVLCLGNGADDAGYGVTSNYNGYGASNYGRLGVETTDVNLIVVKIEFGVGNRDEVTVYRNPKSLLDESACQVDAVLRGNFAFDRISFGNFDGVKRHSVDEIRLGTNFRSVTGQRDHPGENLSGRLARIDRQLFTPPIKLMVGRIQPVASGTNLYERRFAF